MSVGVKRKQDDAEITSSDSGNSAPPAQTPKRKPKKQQKKNEPTRKVALEPSKPEQWGQKTRRGIHPKCYDGWDRHIYVAVSICSISYVFHADTPFVGMPLPRMHQRRQRMPLVTRICIGL